MPLNSFGLGAQARWFLAMLLVVVMLYLLVRRLRGNNTDASLRTSTSTSTGSLSILLSGTMAFLAIAGTAALLLAPEVVQMPVIGVALLVPVVIAWILNKREVAT